jgi:hypothetical protein
LHQQILEAFGSEETLYCTSPQRHDPFLSIILFSHMFLCKSTD